MSMSPSELVKHLSPIDALQVYMWMAQPSLPIGSPWPHMVTSPSRKSTDSPVAASGMGIGFQRIWLGSTTAADGSFQSETTLPAEQEVKGE